MLSSYMPADFFIDKERGIVFSKAVGVCGRAEILDHMDRLVHHADFRREMEQLFDLREVTRDTFSEEDVKLLAARSIFSAHSKRALIVSTDAHYGLGRMFQAYRQIEGEHGITIFREMGEALSWLSLTAVPDSTLFTHLATSIAEE